jgi:predicted nucleotidyltransferase
VTVSAARAAECERVLAHAAAWAAREPGVVGALLVGSFARDEATIDSDVDIVVLSDRADAYREATDWVTEATGERAPVVRSQCWGPVLERRVRLASGLEVEFGFVAPSWAQIDPLDEGTAGVVERGTRTLYDPDGVVSRLATAVSRRGPA